MKNTDIDLHRLMDLYSTMVLIRTCEESLIKPILDREILCPVHLCSGQEAVAAGVCSVLRQSDIVFGSHRSHGHYLAKGGSLEELIAEVYCRTTGCCHGRGGSMHLVASEQGVLGVAPIVAGTIPLAVGAALASSIRGNETIVVAFFGDGAMGEGVLAESMNFAALKKLPIIFVCENNLYSTHLPICECRPPVHIAELGHAYGIPSWRINGNDVLAVYKKASIAASKCRAGKGPVFMECLTYRHKGHVGPNDNIHGRHTDIRPEGEIREWLARDPIVLFEAKLLNEYGIPENDLRKIRNEAAHQVEQAHIAAKKAPFPNGEDLLDHVYAD